MHARNAVLVAFAAMLTLSWATSASAAECKKSAGSGKFALCIGEPLVLTEGHFATTTTNVGATVFSTAGIRTTCSKATGAGELVAEKGVVKFVKGSSKFSECTVTTPMHCHVTEPIDSTELAGRIIKKEEGEGFPASGTIYATVKLEGSGGTCVVAGILKVTSEHGNTEEGPLCTDPDIETTKEVHLGVCEGSKSMLKIGEEALSFSGEGDTKLFKEGTAQKWAVIEGT
ncbi:MAG TPA: hypothetical protein VHT29_04780 [Solirubrobacteraceae bacterium]|jgi:hypothetical protein|nr:hypothetical protein [Solirubrobacteraceae bacterium]